MYLRRVVITVLLVLLVGISAECTAWAANYNAPGTAYDLSGEIGINPAYFNLRDMTWDSRDDAIYMTSSETSFCGLWLLMRYIPGTDTLNNNLNKGSFGCQSYPNIWNWDSLTYDQDTNTLYGGARGTWWGGYQEYIINTSTFDEDITGGSITPGMPWEEAYDPASKTVYAGTINWDGAGGDLLAYNTQTGVVTHLGSQLASVWQLSYNNIYALVDDPVNHVIYIGGSSGKLAKYDVLTGAMQNLNASAVMGTAAISSLAYDQSSGTLYFSGGNLFGAYYSDGTVVNLTPNISPIMGANGIGKIIAAGGYIYIGGGSGKFLRYSIADGTAEDLSGKIDSFWGNNAVWTMAYDVTDNAVFLAGTYGKFARYNPAPETPLVINATVTPQPNAKGWNNTDVAVTFTCGGGTGNIQCPTPAKVSTEGANQIVSGTAVDSSGAAASTSVTVNIDKTPPTITASVSPQPNTNGWNNTDVTVSFTCSDSLSGIEQCPSAVTVSNEGASQVISGAASDNAGNSASATVTVNIDKTPPVITISGITSGATYTLGLGVPTASYSAADALSGVATSGASLTGGDGLGLGTFTYTVTAADKAGNTITQTASYTVIATPAGIISLVAQDLASGGIRDHGLGKSLIMKLDNAEDDYSRGNITAGNNLMQAFISEVQAQTGNAITPQAAAVLIDCANYIISHNG